MMKRRVSVLVWVVRWWVCSDGESKAQGLGTRGRRSSKSCSPAQNAWGCVLLPLPYAACVLPTEPPPLRRLRITAVCRASWSTRHLVCNVSPPLADDCSE